MEIKENQRKIGIILGYANFGVKMLIQLIYVPIMLRLLGESEYGVYQLVASVISYLGILDFGFGSAYLKFYAETIGNKEKEKRLNATYLSIFSLLALLVAVVGLLLATNINVVLGDKLTTSELKLAGILMKILGVNLGINFVNSVFSSFIVSRECFLFQRIINLLSNIVNPLLVIPMLLMGYGSIGMVVASLIIGVTTLLINVWYCIAKIKVPLQIGVLDFGILRRVSKFSFFLLLNIIIDQINWNMDKYLLGRMVGSGAVAVYSIGAQINTIYIQLPDMIASVYAPKINRIVAQKEEYLQELNNLLARVGRIQSIVAACVLLGFALLGKEFISMWAGEEYNKAYYIVLLLITPAFVPLCQSLGVDIQRAMNKHQFRSLIYFIISILNIITSIWLIGIYGEIGAAMGTTFSMLVGNGLIMNIFYHKALKLDMIHFWKNIISIVPSYFIPSIVIIIIKIFIEIDSWFKLVLVGCIFMIFFLLSVYKLGLNDSERGMVVCAVKKVIKKEGGDN